LARAQEVKVIKFNDLEDIIDSKEPDLKIINFWATWCKPCLVELPSFETISEKYHQKGVTVYLVSMDFVSEIERVRAFVKKKKLKSDVLLLNESDYDKWINKVSESWSGSIPATLMIKAGERKFFEKGFDLPALEKEVKLFE
jgi:thiol-disulfide isomerase/thioredoxin